MPVKTDLFEQSLFSFLKNYPPSVLQKGLRLYHKNGADVSILFSEGYVYTVEVPSENTDELYEVELEVQEHFVEADCTCPAYENEDECKHIVCAAIEVLIYDMDMEENKVLGMLHLLSNAGVKNIKQAAVVPMFAGEGADGQWYSFLAKPAEAFSRVQSISSIWRPNWNIYNKTVIAEEKPEIAFWRFKYRAPKGVVCVPEIRYDRKETFSYRCNCKSNTSLCQHIKAGFDILEQKHGREYFVSLKDVSGEKAELLKSYGLTPGDPEAKDIKFSFDFYGNLQMDKPQWLWSANADTDIKKFKNALSPKTDAAAPQRPMLSKEAIIDFEAGFLLNLVSQHFKMGFELEVIKVFEKKGNIQYKKLSIHQNPNLALLKELPDELYGFVISLTDESLKKYISRQGYGYITNYANAWQQLSDEAMETLRKYYIEQLKKLWPFLCEWNKVYALKQTPFSNKSVEPAALSLLTISFSFSIEEDERFITIWLHNILNGEVIKSKEVKFYHNFLFEIDNTFYLPDSLDDLDILKQFRHGFIKIPVANKLQVITNIVPALQKKYTVELPSSFHIESLEPDPKPQLLLKEYQNQYMMLQPQFKYEEITVDYESNPQNILQTLPDGSLQVYQRQPAKEKAFFDSLRFLHPFFERQKQNDFFYLPFDDVMKKHWFISTVRHLQENDIPVLGMQDLKKFRYNTSKPTWEMKTGSGIDWFDLSIQVSFGDQEVSLKDVRKALISKQNIVVLGDGTIGVLPEEWLQQYGMILKIGDEQKDGTLRISKLHYTLIDELHSQIDDEQVLKEIEDKNQRLKNIDNVKTVKVSKHIKASLRPYQLSGFQWLQTLDELGWGGCLADDMGLGKTLQSITFLQYLKEKYAGSTHLVVCPTSLIYNWESELKKFSPQLRYHIYYGPEREFTAEHFEDYDIIITSYGLIRNDLKQLMQFDWHYVILDESQAIKTPMRKPPRLCSCLKVKTG